MTVDILHTAFDANAILAATFIRHVELHDTLASTNDRAIELSRDREIKLPALIATRQQTAGRGRGTNQWHSTAGALTFSVLLEPASLAISAANWPQLSLTVAVAVCDAIAAELSQQSPNQNPQPPRVAIKWPNDIMLDNRKICGILIESPGGLAPVKDRLVIGIGINVNNSMRDASSELASAATSLCDASATQHSPQQVLTLVLNKLQHHLIALGQRDPELPRAWQQLCWLARQNVSAQVGQRTIEGVCTGIGDDGALWIRTALGIERIYSGSLRNRTNS